MQTVGRWLEQLGLAQYTEAFERNAVDLELARELTDPDLEKLGVLALGHRKRLLKAISELNGTGSPAATRQGVSGQPPLERSVGPQAERRQLTVMFCDLVGSTELSTNLDPEALRDLMQAYQRTCGEVIAQYEGHVAQYLGDGLMVYFGWPKAHEDDAVRAIRAGLEITHAVSKLATPTPLSARVGIHTGVVVVGETGQGDASVPKAAVGDTPNIAARLQALAEPGNVVVSERTRGLAGGMFDYADLGAPALKGVSEPVRLFRVSGARVIESRFEAARGDVGLTPLVGREEEIALLLRRWQEAKEGEGQVVLVGGEPGIGKSRLTRVLRERLAQESYMPLRYQCSPYHVNSALYPIIEQFERAAGFTREDTPEQKLDKLEAVLVGSKAQVAELATLFAAMLSLPVDRYPALNLSPQKQKEKTLEALAAQVEALARRQPVLMIYEDVHWIDATTQESLDLLLPRLQGLPVLLIVTYRPEYAPKWAEQAHVTILGLSRLGRRQVAELISKITSGKALPAQVLEQILAHTDGVPLFVEELTKSILESKLLRDAGDRYVLDGPLPALAIPTTLRDSLIARLDRLAPIREVAQIGACIGREFPYDLLAAVSPLKGTRLDEALEQLTQSGLLFRRGTPPDAQYTFKHALVQDAAYDSLLKSKRQQLHAQIAQVIEEKYPDKADSAPELVAHHYTGAGLLEQAIRWWRKAAEVALARPAIAESIAHGDKGVALLGQMPASSLRDNLELDLRVSLGVAWMFRSGWAARQVGDNLEPAWKLAQSLGRSDYTLSILCRLWSYRLCCGQIGEALGWAEQLLAEAQANRSESMWMAANWGLSISHFYSGRFDQALHHADLILSRYEPRRHGPILELQNADAKVNALAYKALALWYLGFPDQAQQTSYAAVDWAKQIRIPHGISYAYLFCVYRAQLARDPTEMEYHIGAMVQMAREHGFLSYDRAFGPVFSSIALVFKRDPAAETSLRLALSRYREDGAEVWVPMFRSVLAQGLSAVGRFDEGLEQVAQALAQIERKGWGERLHHADILVTKGTLLEQKGDPASAEGSYREALDVARQQQAKSLELRAATTLARMWQKQKKREAAMDLLKPIYDWFTEGFDTHDLKHAKALLDELS